MRRSRTRITMVTALVAAFVAVPVMATAQDEGDVGSAKFRAGDDVEIGPGDVVDDDLYVVGGTVRVTGTVDGDLVTGGGQVDVIGTVTGDLVAAGGVVTVDGRVEGDARVAAGQVRVTGDIAEDLVVTTGTLTIASGAEVGRDMVFQTGQATIDGTVRGDARGITAGYDVSGQVLGAEAVTIDEDDPPPTAIDRVWSAVRRWVSLVVFGALLVWSVPGWLRRGHDAGRSRPLVSLLAGQLAVVGVPLLLLLAAILVVLAAVAVGSVALTQLAAVLAATGVIVVVALAMVFVLFVTFVAQAVVALLLGGLVLPQRGRGDQIVAVALGALVLVIVFAAPVVGGIAQYVVVLLGLGALLVAWWRRRSETRAAPTPTPAPTDAPTPA